MSDEQNDDMKLDGMLQLQTVNALVCNLDKMYAHFCERLNSTEMKSGATKTYDELPDWMKATIQYAFYSGADMTAHAIKKVITEQPVIAVYVQLDEFENKVAATMQAMADRQRNNDN